VRDRAGGQSSIAHLADAPRDGLCYNQYTATARCGSGDPQHFCRIWTIRQEQTAVY
jgi:hypothetical protein